MKVGIREGYPRIRSRIGRLASYIQLVRPFTLIAPLVAGIFGSIIRLGSFEQFMQNLDTAIYIAVTLMLAQAAGQAINQAADAELDRIVKPYRPIPRGDISVEEAMGLGFLLGLVAVARAVTVNVRFALAITLILFFAFFYNLPPIKAKKFLGVNLVWMSISRGLLPFIAVWLAYGNVDSTCLQLGTLATVWCLGWQGTKDIPDAEGDMKFGIKTVANTFGIPGLKLLAATCTSVFAVLSIIWGYTSVLFAVAPVAIAGLIMFEVPSPVTENTVGWMSFYVGLALIYVAPAVLCVASHHSLLL